ncbi:MAG: DUF368 domain-containing protein [Eubacteriales bacterium]|nr:DUF368 domain-containing protein [Eubacteriales bacterium]
MKKPTKKWNRVLRHGLAGVLIGLGCILPGVSGGVLAVTLGIYRPLLDAVANFFSDIKKNVLFLLPLGIGGVIGLFLGSLVLSRLMGQYQTPIMYLFIGLIAGGIPGFLREANEGGFRVRWLWAALGGAALAAAMMLLDRGSETAVQAASQALALSPVQALIAGAIIAIGAIVPGISTSFILLYLGWYQAALAAVADRNIVILLCLGAGCLVCGLLIIRLVRWLFTRVRGYAYYCVLGFLLVSMVLIFPGITWDVQQLVNTLLLAAGFLGAYCFDHFLGGKSENADGDAR